MIKRSDFQIISRLRVEESRTLLNNGHWQGSYYLIGYAVECALKACIAKKTQRHSFPDKKITNNVHTHALEDLMKYSELKLILAQDMQTDPLLEQNWLIVTRWNESLRYGHGLTEIEARDMFDACIKRHGILPWIKKRW